MVVAASRTDVLVKAMLGVSRLSEAVKLLPGLAVAIGVMLIALPAASLMGRWLLIMQGIDPEGRASPISGVPVAILFGLLIRNLVPLPESLTAGIQFSVSKLLRLGIVLIGIKLSLGDLLRLGFWGALVVFMPIATGLVFVSWFNRFLKLPERLGTLIAAGTSICGVTAILSIAPGIKADEEEVAYAVANITIFGLLGMLFYPYLAHSLLHSSEGVGLFLGTAIHDTSQVVGAAMTYKEVFHDDKVLQAATVTKLTRNLFLAVVVPLLTFYHLRGRQNPEEQDSQSRAQVIRLIPIFVLGFIVMALARTIGDATLGTGWAYGIWNDADWKWLTIQIGEVWGSRYLLGTALAAIGLGTSLSVFKGVGLKPFAVGLLGAFLVGLVGFLMSYLVSPFVMLR
jgi:uncharacterized integral membrane protein (TIGR00698 family)